MAADEDQNLNDGGGSTLQNTFDPKFEVTSLPKMSLGYSWDYILIPKGCLFMSHQDNCQFNLCHLYFLFINFSKYSVYTRHSINVSRSAALSAILCEMLLKESEHCQGNRQFSGCLSLVDPGSGSTKLSCQQR